MKQFKNNGKGTATYATLDDGPNGERLIYDQVWSRPIQEVAKSYGISGVRLGKVCRGTRDTSPAVGLLGAGANKATVPEGSGKTFVSE